jgi:hypothetical protein
MSAPIGPGDWVECINVTPRHPENSAAHLLTLGALYRVERCGVVAGDPAVWLLGLQSDDISGAFQAYRFRPIYRPKRELTEDLLRRAKEPLRVDSPAPLTTAPAKENGEVG